MSHADSSDARYTAACGTLAAEWDCDASNATWIVDRLERLGLAERLPDPDDRRVKMVVLTSKGAATKAELMEEFFLPPDDLLNLSRVELATLESLLAKVTPQSGGASAMAADSGRSAKQG